MCPLGLKICHFYPFLASPYNLLLPLLDRLFSARAMGRSSWDCSTMPPNHETKSLLAGTLQQQHWYVRGSLATFIVVFYQVQAARAVQTDSRPKQPQYKQAIKRGTERERKRDTKRKRSK